MKTLATFMVCLFAATVIADPASKAASGTGSQQKSGQAKWRLRVFQFPAPELISGFDGLKQAHLRAPAMPPPDASTAAIKEFLKESREVVSQYLETCGVLLTDGSQAAYDPASQTLAVWSVYYDLDLVESFADSLMKKVPVTMSASLHVVEADAAIVRAAIEAAALHPDVGASWEQIQAMIAKGDAHEVETLRMETRSGQPALVTHGTVLHSGDHPIEKGEQWPGTRFECTPVILPSGRTMKVAYQLKHQFSATTSSVILNSGMVKLLGVWKPMTGAAPDDSSRLRAAFLAGTIVPALLPLDQRVAQWLEKYADKVESTPPPVVQPEPPNPPPGMVLRTFQVTPDFLQNFPDGDERAGDGKIPPDPFASPPSSKAGDISAVDHPGVGPLSGISFPEGSSAVFNPVTGELVVRNLPENLQKLDSMVHRFLSKTPVTVAISVHVVQGDAGQIRGLVSKVDAKAYHSEARRTLKEMVAEGKAKILESAWLETYSGQRAVSSAGFRKEEDVMDEMGAKAPSPAGDPKPGADEKKQPPSDAGASAGFSVEAEPVVGSDSSLVDLTYALSFGSAAPKKAASATAEDKTPPTGSVPRFYRADVKGALTMRPGTIRIVGMWKPEGPPESPEMDILQVAFLRMDIVHVEDAANGS